MRRTRLANLLMLLAALLFLVGGGALVLAAGPSGWADLAAAVRHMLAGRWIVLLVLLVLMVGVTIPLLVLVSRSVSDARGRRAGSDERGVGRVEVEGEKLVRSARRALDLEICRSRPVLDRVVDALLGTPVDLGVERLYLEPTEMVVELSVGVGDERHAVTSMPPPLYEKVLDQLREMIGVSGETGDGVVDLRSSKGARQILVRLQRRPTGVRTRLQLLTEGAVDSQSGGPLKRRRSNSMVFRIEPPPIGDVRTGEIPIMPVEEHEGTDPGSGLLTGVGHTGRYEVAGAVEREIGKQEATLRLIMGVLLLVSTVLLYWDAFGWGIARAGGHNVAPWRNVTIRVGSSPAGDVVIAGETRGRTPLTLTEPCRGRTVDVLVRARGYATWQWSGICPESGELSLSARLQPRE